MVILDKIANPIKNWQVNREEIRFIGTNLQRPECILTEPDETIWTADARGGVMHIFRDGSQQLLTSELGIRNSELGEKSSDGKSLNFGTGNSDLGDNNIATIKHPKSEIRNPKLEIQNPTSTNGSLPNGICFDENGNFIIANWGTDHIELMTRDGKTTTILSEIDGQPLGKTNFPLRDSKGRIWFTVTTCTIPWTEQLNTRATDGYIALMDENGIRIVADGFCGTNEIRFDDEENWLYVVESTGHKISRLRVKPNGDLYGREVYANVSGFPDGFAFDAYGNLWITLIFTDQLAVVTPEGEELIILDDSNYQTKFTVPSFRKRTITGEILASVQGTLCPWMSSLSFGGKDMKTVYLGKFTGNNCSLFPKPGSRAKNDTLEMKELFDLNGKTALIVGSSSGMGKEIAALLGIHGATVIVSSNDEKACNNVLIDFNEKGIKAFAIPCDVSKRKEINFLVNEIQTKIGRIDILICCAGIAIAGSFLEMSEEGFKKTMEINLQSAIYLTKLVIPGMQKNKDGSIIYLSSIAGVRGNKTLGLYGISKAGLSQLARNLAVEFGPDNIRVNTISPGVIDTEFAIPLTSDIKVMKKRLLLTPLRRIGKVEEVAGVALLLASKAGGFITGQDIIVDGGTTISDGN